MEGICKGTVYIISTTALAAAIVVMVCVPESIESKG